jgi:hypothetical protein
LEGGLYTKVGRQVTVTGFVSVTSVASPVGGLLVQGLPFAAGANLGNRSSGSVYLSNLSATAATSVVSRIVGGEQQIRIDKYAAGTISNLAGDVVAASSFHFSLTYFV